MDKIIISVIIITTLCCSSAKHIFISTQKSWYNARQYCKNHHVDLSCLSSYKEEELFRKSVDEDNNGWIGLYWSQNINTWKWSNGENLTYHNNLIDLSSGHKADNIYWKKDGWEWRNGDGQDAFFCFTLTVVQEEKTWEEALEYCTENHFNLTSLLSETDNLLAVNEINQTGISGQVWIGLRYLGDSWLWVNGDPLGYKAWSKGDQDQQSPMKRRCGALTQEGVWESWDCQEKLPFICSSV